MWKIKDFKSKGRKTVKNNLSGYLNSSEKAGKYLEKAGIDPMLRAEVLTIDQMLRLSEVIDSEEK